MKIAITGASGYIGQEVRKRLLGNADIYCLTRSSPVDTGVCTWLETDYSIDSLCNILIGIDCVIHLAAIRGTHGTIADYQENEYLTENILLAMGNCGVPHIIFASSIAVYSDVRAIPWKEDMVLTPKTLYGITKATCEHLCALYSKKYGFTYTILRIAQVLGQQEKIRGMINNFIDLAARGEQLTVIGKSIASRQYIYVNDLSEAIVKCALHPARKNIVFNIGMEKAYTNYQIAEIINDVFENPTSIEYKKELSENVESTYMDIHRYKEQLSLKPKNLSEAIAEIKERLR